MQTTVDQFLLTLSRLRKGSGAVNMRNISHEQIGAAIRDAAHIKGYLSYIQEQMKNEVPCGLLQTPKTELHARLEQINTEMTTLGIDTTMCDDGSDIVRLFMNKRATPKGTMCSQEYKQTTAKMYEEIKTAQEKLSQEKDSKEANQRTLANHILRLHQHLSSTRPINLQRFRDQFELLFDERLAVLAEIRAAEVDWV